jgi:hypothetical protein
VGLTADAAHHCRNDRACFDAGGAVTSHHPEDNWAKQKVENQLFIDSAIDLSTLHGATQ